MVLWQIHIYFPGRSLAIPALWAYRTSVALPYLPYGLTEHQYYDRIVKSCKKHHELRSRELFQHAEKQEVPENCFIPIERIHGRLLIIAAADDSMWESEKYAMRMEQRLASLPHPSEAEAVIYPYGTHLLLPYSAGRIGPLDIRYRCSRC